MGVFDIFTSKKPEVQNVVKKSHGNKVAEKAITKRAIYEVFNDLETLRTALDQANTQNFYNREELHQVYRQIWRDPHLQSQWNTRKLKTLSREWKIVDSSDNENEQLTEILERPWFGDFVGMCLDSKMWGFNLIQFGSWGGKSFEPFMLNKEMKDNIYPIDRDYVKPELGLIVTTPSSVESGIDMFDKKFWTLFVGESHNLGLMEYLAATILIKNNANTNWSEWAEIFGMDLKTVKTDKTDNARSQLLTALKNLGSNGYGVFSPEDEIEFAGTSRTDAYKVYENLIRYSDEQISKIIFGQDVVSNNTGQVVGKTGENIAKLYGNADAKFIKAQVNDKLLPFLTRIGAGNFEGYKFVYDTSEELTLTERSDIDLKISQMGKQHSDNYINDTYGVEVEAISTANDTAQVAEAIQNLYK